MKMCLEDCTLCILIFIFLWHSYLHFLLHIYLFTFSYAYLFTFSLRILTYLHFPQAQLFTFPFGIYLQFPLQHNHMYFRCFLSIFFKAFPQIMYLYIQYCTVQYIVPLLPEVHFSLSIHFLIFTQPHTFIYIFIHKYFLYLKKKYLHFSLTIQMSTFFSLHIKHLICTF